MKTILKLLMLSCIVAICMSCSAAKQLTTNTSHVRTIDTVTVVDTVYNTITVVKHERDSAAINALQSKNDSLLNALQSKDEQLDYLADKLRRGQFNIDTIHAETEHARAWAAVVNNDLKLGIEQLQVDTTTTNINTTNTVTDRIEDKQSTTEVIVERQSFYENSWFWTTLILLAFIALMLFLKR